MTAAHCVKGQSPSQMQVRVGLHYLSEANQRNTYAVRRIYSNPSYSRTDRPGDYAILELAQPIEFIQGRVEPACINTMKQNYQGDLIATGKLDFLKFLGHKL